MAELITAAGGGGGLVGGAAILINWLLKRGARAEEKVEETAATKLDQVAADIGTVKSDLRVLVNELGSHKVSVEKLGDRVEGMSKAYGPKLDIHAEAIAKLQVQVAGLLERKRR